MAAFALTMSDDGIPVIWRDCEVVGRALTKKDGESIVEVLNRLAAGHNSEFRERILAEVSDAIENCFDGVA